MIKRTVPATRKPAATADNTKKVSEVIATETTKTIETSDNLIPTVQKTPIVKKAPLTRRKAVSNG